MGAAEAATAQGMATRHRRSVKAVQAGLGEINALLAKMMKLGKIKFKGYGTHAVWYVRKLAEEAAWNSGQLRKRDFEEKDPMDEATLPYCYIDRTYGIGEKSIKSNRAAGSEKIYDLQKENALVAQSALYRAVVSALYSNGSDALVPVGLDAVCGRPYEGTANVTTAAARSYAGIQMAAAAITAWNKDRATMGWANDYWYPTIIDVGEIPVKSGTAKWNTDAVKDLAWMTHRMSRTADKSGTGAILRPDMALLGSATWSDLYSLLITSQKDVAGVPVGVTDAALANFTTMRVGHLDVVYDENVPLDTQATPVERVFVLDSKTFYIETQNTKAEGLIEGKWQADDVDVAGGRGMYKANMMLICKTPLAVGCITGCDNG